MTSNKSAAFSKMIGGAASVVIVTVILVAANIIAANLRLRRDMTEEKLYSLSDGTRAILGEMDSDITLKFFFNSSSPEVPVFLKEFGNRINDLLTEYSLASGGKVKIERYDPKPDSDEEEWAERYGIPGQPMGMTGDRIFLGIAAVSGDSEAAIPVIDPRAEDLVEYNITRLIHRISNPAKPRVGVISTLPVLNPAPSFMMPQGQIRQRPWMAFQELQKNTELVELTPETDAIPADLSTLILVHPKGFNDKTLLAIDQFVMRGGKLLAIMDPFSITEAAESPAMGMMGQPPSSSDLGGLLDAWQIRYTGDRIAADMASATRVNAGNGVIQENPMWLLFRTGSMNKDDILTAGLETIMQPFAGTFSAEQSETRSVTPLITTSPDSGMVSQMAAQMGPEMMKREFRIGGAGLHTALRVTGKFKTAFPDGITVENETESAENKDSKPAEKIMPSLTEGESTVILIGDSDMFADRFCVEQLNFFGFQGFQPINDNVNFLANIIEQLSGSPHLIGIRSRGRFERPFTKVLALEQTARREWQAREEELMQKLQAAQQRLNELQAQKDPQQKLILSPAQREAIASFQKEETDIKHKLKEVRKNLRRDIDNLGLTIKILNIGAIPLLVGLAGIAYGLMRKSGR